MSRPVRSWSAKGWLIRGCLLLPSTASAHVSFEGSSDFANGVMHPLTTSAHLLLLIGLGLMLGQQGPPKIGAIAAVFAPASAVAFMFGALGHPVRVPPTVPIALTLLSGALIAFVYRSRWIETATLALAGFALGSDTIDYSASGHAPAKMALGAWLALSVVVGDVAYYSSCFARAQWLRLGVRIAGSWLVAISVLMLAFLLRGGAAVKF